MNQTELNTTFYLLQRELNLSEDVAKIFFMLCMTYEFSWSKQTVSQVPIWFFKKEGTTADEKIFQSVKSYVLFFGNKHKWQFCSILRDSSNNIIIAIDREEN